MAKKKPLPGSLLRISLGDGYDGFARVLPNTQVAVYGTRMPHEAVISPETIYESSVLWKLTVMKSALTSGRWTVTDRRPLEPELAAPVKYFMQDRLTGQYSTYRSSDGYTEPSNYEECKELEAVAAWEAEHVEDRLRDYFAGRPNVWEKQLKAKP